MRRSIALAVVTVAGLVVILMFRTRTVGSTGSAKPPAAVSRPPLSGPVSSVTAPSSSAIALPPGHHVVTGDPISTTWGVVQVRVTVDRHRITDVAALRLPHGNPMDIELSSMAVPKLRAAVLAAQSAAVDMVSQATVTSDGYLRSLQSALDLLHG